MSTDQEETNGSVVPLTRVAEGSVPPPDEAAHLDGRLMHELSAINWHLGQYVLRYYDADAGRAKPVPIDDERALADSVAAAAEVIRARVTRRERQNDEP